MTGHDTGKNLCQDSYLPTMADFKQRCLIIDHMYLIKTRAL